MIGNKPEIPSDIEINKEFAINWIYPDPSNSESHRANIEITATEYLFDVDNRNIEVRNNKFIKIKDAGRYQINISAKSQSGAVLKKYVLYIDKFHRSDVNEVSYYSDLLGFEPPCFYLGDELCEDDMTLVSLESTCHNAYEIQLTQSCLFPKRYCLYRYKKYRRLSGYARRMDVRDLVDTSSYTPILFEAGSSSKFHVDVPILIANSEDLGLGEGTITRYICYYAFIVPEDNVRLVEE